MLLVSLSVSYDLDSSLWDSDLDSDLPVGDSATTLLSGADHQLMCRRTLQLNNCVKTKKPG